MIIAGAFFSIFAIAIPLWQSDTTADKVDRAIDEMKIETEKVIISFESRSKDFKSENEKTLQNFNEEIKNLSVTLTSKVSDETANMKSQFNELAGIQLRKPNIKCLFNNLEINDLLFTFNQQSNDMRFELKNIGNAKAIDVRIVILLKIQENSDIYIRGQFFLEEDYYISDTLFNVAFGPERIISIEPNYPKPFFLTIYNEKKIDGLIPAQIKIYYGEPQPTVYNFKIKFNFQS